MERQNPYEFESYILQKYNIEPYFIERFGNVMKIYGNKGTFALKSIPARRGADFIHEVRSLYQKGYNRIVPVYPTVDGRYAILLNDKLYYLMPWVTNEMSDQRTTYEKLFRELARLHTLSVREVKIDSDERANYYEATMLAWKSRQQFIDEFIEHCESKWYMSPFELLFCLYYNDIREALQYSIKQFEKWDELTKENNKARTVSLHGKVELDHFLVDEAGYGFFINFENTKRAPASHDLLPFITANLGEFLTNNDDITESLFSYFNYFPFKDDEQTLFLSYLAYPGKLIKVLENYYFKKENRQEMKFVIELQEQYWNLKKIEYVVMKIEERDRLQKEASAQANEQKK